MSECENCKAKDQQIAELKAELAKTKEERNEMLYSNDTLQCDIASAFGWSNDGKDWADKIREVLAENEQLKGIVDKLDKTEDGVPITPESEPYKFEPSEFVNNEHIWPFFPPRQAAEAAKEGEE